MNKQEEKILLITSAIGVICIFLGGFTQPISETLALVIGSLGVILTFVSITSLVIAFVVNSFKSGANSLVEKGSEATKAIQKKHAPLEGIFKTQKKDLENFLRLLEVSSDDELAEHLIFATIARNENPDLTVNLLNNLHNSSKERVHKIKAELQMLNLQLKDNFEFSPIVAGNVIWIMTLRSVEGFEHLLVTKKIWRELRRGHKRLKKKAADMQLEDSENIVNKAKFIPKL